MARPEIKLTAGERDYFAHYYRRHMHVIAGMGKRIKRAYAKRARRNAKRLLAQDV